MIEIKVMGSTINFDKHEHEIECPHCRLETWISFGEIMRNDFIICRGCHANIILEDHLGDFKKGIKTIENLLKNFEKSHG